MARLKKEKTNYEERFGWLYCNHSIKGNADLLGRMFDKYYRDKLEEKIHRQVWINSQLSDFRNKIKGNRSFLESDIKAIERALDMRWVDIVEPLPKKPEKNKKFEEKGIRYAAYIDEEWYYQELADSYDEDEYNVVLFNYDEYGKTIIDYVIENKAENGLRFLIFKGYLRCDSSLQFGGRIYRAEELSEELWNWIVSIDDSELFVEALGEKNLFDFSFYREEEGKEFLGKIIETKKIFESLCNERVHPNSNLRYMPSLLFEALKFSLSENKQFLTQRIISAYMRFIEKQIVALQNQIYRENNFCIGMRHPVQREIRHGESLIMYAWDFSELPKKSGGFENQIALCEISNITKRLMVKNLSEMEYGDYFLKGGTYYIKKEPDISLEALKYLTKEKGCKFLPAYMGEESGVSKIRACQNEFFAVEYSELGEMLGEIHLFSQEKLGADRVYMYSRGFTNGNGLGHVMHLAETKVITNWQSCEIGTPILDIITAFLNYKHTNRYFEERFTKGGKQSYEELSQFLNAYPDKRIIENFGDKFNEELDKMLKDAIQNAQERRAETIENLYMAKSFAEIYRNDLNLITKQSCDLEGEK